MSFFSYENRTGTVIN